jgi:hypothetical protein
MKSKFAFQRVAVLSLDIVIEHQDDYELNQIINILDKQIDEAFPKNKIFVNGKAVRTLDELHELLRNTEEKKNLQLLPDDSNFEPSQLL